MEERMLTARNIRRTGTVREVFGLLLGCALLGGVVFAQEGQNRPDASARDNVADAKARLKQGTYFLADMDRLAKGGVTEAIPDLTKQFGFTQDPYAQGAIASALVRLGDKDPVYWDYLVKGAEAAIHSDAPYPAGFDANGKLVPGTSPEFSAWAKAHNISAEDALDLATRGLPAKVAYLGETGDPRAIPLLRQALSSPNFMIQTFAALELAQLKDKDSIPLIIEVCRKAPADAARTIAAESLSQFNDPQAHSAVMEFAPAREAK